MHISIYCNYKIYIVELMRILTYDHPEYHPTPMACCAQDGDTKDIPQPSPQVPLHQLPVNHDLCHFAWPSEGADTNVQHEKTPCIYPR